MKLMYNIYIHFQWRPLFYENLKNMPFHSQPGLTSRMIQPPLLLPNAYLVLPGGLHGRSVTVVGVAADLGHVLGHVVDGGHLVAMPDNFPFVTDIRAT